VPRKPITQDENQTPLMHSMADQRCLHHKRGSRRELGLSAVEAAYDIIEVGVDLLPLDKFTGFDTDRYQRLTDGSPLTVVFPLHDSELLAERGVSLPATAVETDVVLLLPPGRLASIPGAVIVLRFRPAGGSSGLAPRLSSLIRSSCSCGQRWRPERVMGFQSRAGARSLADMGGGRLQNQRAGRRAPFMRECPLVRTQRHVHVLHTMCKDVE
jgi:hypothetical protein